MRSNLANILPHGKSAADAASGVAAALSDRRFGCLLPVIGPLSLALRATAVGGCGLDRPTAGSSEAARSAQAINAGMSMTAPMPPVIARSAAALNPQSRETIQVGLVTPTSPRPKRAPLRRRSLTFLENPLRPSTVGTHSNAGKKVRISTGVHTDQADVVSSDYDERAAFEKSAAGTGRQSLCDRRKSRGP
jgi:hypothetical protein